MLFEIKNKLLMQLNVFRFKIWVYFFFIILVVLWLFMYRMKGQDKLGKCRFVWLIRGLELVLEFGSFFFCVFLGDV